MQQYRKSLFEKNNIGRLFDSIAKKCREAKCTHPYISTSKFLQRGLRGWGEAGECERGTLVVRTSIQ